MISGLRNCEMHANVGCTDHIMTTQPSCEKYTNNGIRYRIVANKDTRSGLSAMTELELMPDVVLIMSTHQCNQAHHYIAVTGLRRSFAQWSSLVSTGLNEKLYTKKNIAEDDWKAITIPHRAE